MSLKVSKSVLSDIDTLLQNFGCLMDLCVLVYKRKGSIWIDCRVRIWKVAILYYFYFKKQMNDLENLIRMS